MAIEKIFTSRSNSTSADTFVGQLGQLFYDPQVGVLKRSDGVTPGGKRIIISSEDVNLSFGDFYAEKNNLSMIKPDEDMNLISNGAGAINIVGDFRVHTTDAGITASPVFGINSNGEIEIRVGIIPVGSTGVKINGSNNNVKASQRPGTMLHVSGNNGVSSLIVNDSFGDTAVPSVVMRKGRGSTAVSTPVQLGDSFARFAGTGWGTTNFSIDATEGSNTSIEFKARQSFTDTASGSEIVFYVAPLNSTVKTQVAKINTNGITSSKFTGNSEGVHTHLFKNANDVSGTTLTLDFETEDLIRCSFTTNFTIAFANLAPGKCVTVIATNLSTNGTDIITVGIPNIHMSNNDNTITVSAERTAFLRFWSTGTTANDLFCQATYG